MAKKQFPLLVKCFFIFMLLESCLFTYFDNKAAAQTTKTNAKTLVIYSSPGNTINQSDRLLDMSLGQFTSKISFKSSKTVTKKDLTGVTHLIYYGEVKENLPKQIRQIFDTFKGTKMAIGFNSEQLGKSFIFFKGTANQNIHELSLSNSKKVRIEERSILGMKISDDSKVLIKGYGKGREFPLLIQKQDCYYFATSEFDSPLMVYFSETLHDFFQKQDIAAHPAYIRLEDVHPLADPKVMKELADYLKEKKIPYMISIIPIYKNPKTKKEVRFSDSPALLKVLQYMQNNGGSIILHGYSHQYRDDETGEGTEFWDVDHNMPISADPKAKIIKKSRNDFKTQQQYEAYLANIKKYETNYINTKIQKGIQELVSNKLYPLAFEAPHYAMSLNGYHILSKYFSTYVGQLQISEKDWHVMYASPGMSTPSFLHGMKLLPETIGYVDPKNPHAIDDMMKAAELQSVDRDGYISGFYHPYLGVKKFKMLISRLESIPNIQWIDLKKMNNTVKMNNIKIHSSSGKNVEVGINYVKMLKTSPGFFKPLIEKITNNSMWVIAAGSGIMIILFILYIFVVQQQRRKIERGI